MKKIIPAVILFTLIELYPQGWQVIENAEMLLPVYGGEAVVIDSLIYVVGGFSDSLNQNVKVIQEFNPQNNSWRIIDSINGQRYGCVADNYQGGVLVLGGISLNLSFNSSLELWEPGNLPVFYNFQPDFIRTFATGLIHNNIFFVFGGVSADPLSSYMFEYYIPDSTIIHRDNFGFLTFYPFQQMSAFLENSVFLFGGVFIGSSRAIYRYDIQNKILDLLQTELLQSRAGGEAVKLGDSLIYLIGGFNENSLSLSSVEIFSNLTGNYSCSSGPKMNFERSELMAAEYNNSIYVFGGKDDNGEPVDQVEKLSLLTGVDEDFYRPDNFVLYPNYPNPFNPSTSISFYIPSRSFVRIKIYNLAGEEILELVNSEMERGVHTIPFSAAGSFGGNYKNRTNLSSSVYFYSLTAFNFSTQNTYIATRKMLLLK